MNKTALYEMWTALVAVFRIPGKYPRPAMSYVYNKRTITRERHF